MFGLGGWVIMILILKSICWLSKYKEKHFHITIGVKTQDKI